MRRQTQYSEKLNQMYIRQDGRLCGEDGWEKLPYFWFLLFLSYRCTRRCDYCYAFNQVGDGNTTEMDGNTFARLLEWIPEVWKTNYVKVNAISFLGGEPLLWTGRIKQIMDAVYQNTDGMQGIVNTNGDLVDSLNWDDLEAIQWITTNITDIDIAELSRRMAIVQQRSNVISQTIAATMDEYNLERIIDITRFGIESGYRLRFNRNLYKGMDNGYQQRLLVKYHELCDVLEDYVTRGFEVHTTFLLDTLIPSWELDASPYHCGKRIATVYPDGSIGPCLRDHTFKTGTIFDDDPLSRLQRNTFHYDLNSPNVPHECKQCDVKSACQGGCPHDKLLLNGTAVGKSIVCDIHREIIPRLKHLDALIGRVADVINSHELTNQFE